MKFLVFRSTDSALVLVPAVIASSSVGAKDGSLTFAAACDLDLGALTPDAVVALGLRGRARVSGSDVMVVTTASALGGGAGGD